MKVNIEIYKIMRYCDLVIGHLFVHTLLGGLLVVFIGNFHIFY